METNSIILIRTYLSRIIKYAVYLFMVAILTVVFVQVVFRYVFAHPFPWAEELARYCFIWVSVLGSVLAIESKDHFSLVMVVEKLNPKIRRFVDLSTRIVVTFFLVILTYYSIKLTIIGSTQTSPALGLPLSYVLVMLPVGFFLMSLFLITTGIGSNSREDAEVL